MQTRDCSFRIRFNAYKINLISVISILDVLFFGRSQKISKKKLLWQTWIAAISEFDERFDILSAVVAAREWQRQICQTPGHCWSNKNPNKNKNKFHDY